MSPPMWFLGAYEMTAGGVDRRPAARRDDDRGRPTTIEPPARCISERRRQFPAMARRAALAHRPDVRSSPPPPTCGMRGACRRSRLRRRRRFGGAGGWASGSPTRSSCAIRRRAPGFYFTLAAMWRSNTHRLTLACAAAAGFAMAVVALSGRERRSRAQARRRGCSRCSRCSTARCSSAFATSSACRRSCAPTGAFSSRGAAASARSSPASGAPPSSALVMPALVVLLPLFVFVLGPQLRADARRAGTRRRDRVARSADGRATTRCRSPAPTCRART